MGSRELTISYKETRLNLEPSPPSSVVQIRIQAPGAFKRSSSHRANGAYTAVAEDEKTYRARNLATASSVYHRKHHNSPRSFLWRVLENDTVLSIRVADVCKQQNDPDSNLVLDLQFPNALRPSCLDFADSKEHDALSIFVVDQANQLYTITLRPDAFKKRAATDGGLGDACKPYSPPGFGFKHPHRLLAVSTDQLIVTMHDGGILRFDRNRSHEGMRLRYLAV
jgi:nuclear pore complex protein Nup160